MQTCRKMAKIFIFFLLFLKFTLFSSNLFSVTWGGILPYCYYYGKAYVLVAFDSKSSNDVWSNFAGKINDKKNLLKKIAESAHFGTRGVFAGVQDNLLSRNDVGQLVVNSDNLLNGISFFRNRLDKDKSFVGIHGRNVEYNLFFVKVPFVTPKTLMTSFYDFQMEYGGRGFNEYLRYNGYAWINAMELLRIIESKNENCNSMRDEIYIKADYESFIKKSSLLKRRYPGITVILNSYLSDELRSQQGIRILKVIIEDARNSRPYYY